MSLAIIAAKQVIENLKTLDSENLKQEKDNISKLAETIDNLNQLSCLSSTKPLEKAFTGLPDEDRIIESTRNLFEPISNPVDDIESIEDGFDPDDFSTQNDFVNKTLQHYIFYRNNNIGTELHDYLNEENFVQFKKLLQKIPEKFIPDLIRVKDKENKTLLELAVEKANKIYQESGNRELMNICENMFEKIPAEDLTFEDCVLSSLLGNKNLSIKLLYKIPPAALNVIYKGSVPLFHCLDLLDTDLLENLLEKTSTETLNHQDSKGKTILELILDRLRGRDIEVIDILEPLTKKIMDKMSPKAVSCQNSDNNTALHFLLNAPTMKHSPSNKRIKRILQAFENITIALIDKMPPDAFRVKDNQNKTLLEFAVEKTNKIYQTNGNRDPLMNICEKMFEKIPAENLTFKDCVLSSKLGNRNLSIKLLDSFLQQLSMLSGRR